MLEKYAPYRILSLFFDSPTRKFQLREICRETGMGLPSVRNHVKMLEKAGFVKKNDLGTYPSYSSSRNERFKLYRRRDVLIRLQESGLVDFLADRLLPDAIVLFGSSCRGDDVEASDIDLFIVARERDVDLKKFESKLKRKISLHFNEKPTGLSKELLSNIINGIVVYGYLEVFV